MTFEDGHVKGKGRTATPPRQEMTGQQDRALGSDADAFQIRAFTFGRAVV